MAVKLAKLTTLQVVEFLVGKAPGRTQRQLAEAIFGERGYQQRVNVECDMLVRSGLVEQRGGGGPNDPFRYYPSATANLPASPEAAGARAHAGKALEILGRVPERPPMAGDER